MKFACLIILSEILSVVTIDPEMISRAISIAIEETCLRKTTTVDIRLLSNDTNIDGIMKHSSLIPSRIETSFNLVEHTERKKCNIFVMKTFNEFEEFQANISPQIFDFRGNFLIIFINGKTEEIHKIFNIMWKFHIVNVNAIYAGNSEIISMSTFLPFQNYKCSDTSPIIINEFKAGKFTRNTFFIDKLENLQQCPVRVVIATKSEPYIVLENGKKHRGRDISLMDELAHSLNFKINYIILEDKGFLLDNGTAGGIFKLLQNGSADMTICDMWITRNRATFFDPTTPYISDDIIFVMPPRGELSPVAKLIYPLDRDTWILLIVFFGIGYIVIFIISFQSKAVQDFVFGENETHPFLNMFNTFLGGNQVRMPTKNFARFILLIFLTFSMIIRTAYQGAMYQFMQSDKKYKEPQTIEELIELNYKFHVLAVSMELFEHFTGLQKRIVTVNSKQRQEALLATHNPTFDGVVALAKGMTIYQNQKNRNGVQYIILKERVMSIPSAIFTPKNFFLIPALNDKIHKLKSGGIIDYWHSMEIDKRFENIAAENKGPNALNVRHFIGCFQMLAVSYFISFLAFINEFILWRLKKK